MISPPLPQKSLLALLALVPALLILKAAKRTPKEPRLLKDLKDVADADHVVVQRLFDSEFDIIIVGGGRSPFVSILVPQLIPTSHRNRGLCSRRPSLRGTRSSGFTGRIW